MKHDPPRGSFPYPNRKPPPTERLRLIWYAFQRTAWHLRYRHPNFGVPPHDPILVVFGMHRSGTSSAVGIIEDLGFTVPGMIPPDGTGDNKRGTREPIALTSLTNNVLQVNGASWREPPTKALKYLNRHMAERNRIICQCIDGRYVLKDPRMILMLELWDGVLIKPMAVVRNPVDVADSLARRGEPLTQRQGISLWKTYNRALLHYARKNDCPIAFFDEPDFADQVIRCTHHLGYNDVANTRFFEGHLVRSRAENWRDTVEDREAISLYDDLARVATTSSSSLPLREVGRDVEPPT